MNSIRARLFLSFFIIILVVVLAVGGGLWLLLLNHPLAEQQTLNRLSDAAQLIGQQAPLAAGFTRPEARRYVQRLARSLSARVLIVSDQGEVLVDSEAGGAALRLAAWEQRATDPAPDGTRTGRVRDSKLRLWLCAQTPLEADRNLVLCVARLRQLPLVFFRNNLLWPVLQAAALGTLLAVPLALLIARSIARPLQTMAATATAIARGDYSQTAPVSGPAEVRALGLSLNSMARQVEAAQQAQRDFLANVSHELRTPLTSIAGFAQAVSDGTAATPEAVRRSATIIYEESARLGHLVEELLDLTRLGAGRRELARAPLDLPQLLAATVEKFAWRARDQAVALSLAVPAGLPPLVGDAERLAQVFTNLIDNALKHTPRGGRIVVHAGAVAGGVEVSVTDNGAGIAPADLPRLFERFYQVDKARAGARGVGLGLAITREIVAAHGGQVRAESVLGLGAKFSVFLPGVPPANAVRLKKPGPG